jgi:heat-inducible transcriptional repressor
MVRTVDYDTRRKAVLAATINEYIQDALPVSSEGIAQNFSLSPATIRNIFVELEDAGLLTHPHTSAGRVPTDKGYRYYVDFLLAQIGLLEEEKERVANEYRKEIRRLEDALELTSDILSRLTHYASLVSFLEWQDKFFYNGVSAILDEPEFQDARHTRSLIRMLEEKRRILNVLNRDFKEKVKVYIGEELGCSEINDCALVVSNFSVKSRPLGRIAVLGPMRMKYDHTIPALEYISDILTGVLEEF